MSDAPRPDDWWQASDGKWYPPRDQAPQPGWWLASDGNWYPPTSTSSNAESTAASTSSKPDPVPSPTRPDRVANRNRPNPPPNDGISAQDQIARRDLASQADREVLARSRALAASKLLASLADELPQNDATIVDPDRHDTPESGSPEGGSSGAMTTTERDPLLEVRQSTLTADVEHLGERLAIFTDRVELRDHDDAVRQSVLGADITDIMVNQRLTGAVLTIETIDGPVMVAKGLRPEQAEEARQLIMRKTRPSGPVRRAGSRSAPPEHVGGPASSARPIDEADILRKLGELHRLGILTNEEYETKIGIVGSLVRGEITLPA